MSESRTKFIDIMPPKKNPSQPKKVIPKAGTSEEGAACEVGETNASMSVENRNPEIEDVHCTSDSDDEPAIQYNLKAPKKQQYTRKNGHYFGIRVPFPKFTSEDVEAWFSRLEQWFILNGAGTEGEKFAALVTQVDHRSVINLSEVANPSADKPYSKLKDKMIVTFADSSHKKIKKLVSGLQLGDLKPSQLLNELRKVGGKVDNDILKSLWMQRLPIHARTIIAAATDVPLNELAVIADTVLETIGHEPNIAKIDKSPNKEVAVAPSATQPANSEINALRLEIAELKGALLAVDANRSRPQNRNEKNYRNRTPSRSKKEESKVCFYHRRFGDKATRCTTPCAYVKDTGESSSEPKN